jgi:hypothetical protein
VPFTPAGLGLVEVGVAGILITLYTCRRTTRRRCVLVDRAISVLSSHHPGRHRLRRVGQDQGLGLRRTDIATEVPTET